MKIQKHFSVFYVVAAPLSISLCRLSESVMHLSCSEQDNFLQNLFTSPDQDLTQL